MADSPSVDHRERLGTIVRALLTALVLLLLALPGASTVDAQGADAEADAIEVRVAAQRLPSGKTEFAAQQRQPDWSWSERLLPQARFFPASTEVGRWLSSTPLTVSASDGGRAEIRIAARLLADGRMEFAAQQRNADGEWGERLLPRARFFPADPRPGRWLVSTPLMVTPPTAGSVASDRAALLAFYEATDGPNWKHNTNWLSDRPLGEWHGVTTNDDGRVTELQFSANHMGGSLPPVLGRLTQLEVLSIGGNGGTNRMTGAVPVELAALTKLRTLSLRGVGLRGPIPPELGRLTSLTALQLGSGQLSGPVPVELAGLANLEWLSLYSNDLSGAIPAELGSLRNLRGLDLSGNGLRGPIPPELGRLGNLERLALAGNELSGPIPAELGELSNLEVLALYQNQLDGPIPAVLATLTNLRVLSLEWNRLSGPIPAGLSRLTELEHLDLNNNQLSGPIPAGLGRLTKLQRLALSENDLSGPIPAQLGDLADLRVLRLSWNRLSGPIPTTLGGLINLMSLSLAYNQLSGPIPVEFRNLASLQSLVLGENRLTGEIPADLGSLADLRDLKLDGNQLTGPIPAELGSLGSLIILYLDGNELTGPIPGRTRLARQIDLATPRRQRVDRADSGRTRPARRPAGSAAQGQPACWLHPRGVAGCPEERSLPARPPVLRVGSGPSCTARALLPGRPATRCSHRVELEHRRRPHKGPEGRPR